MHVLPMSVEYALTIHCSSIESIVFAFTEPRTSYISVYLMYDQQLGEVTNLLMTSCEVRITIFLLILTVRQKLKANRIINNIFFLSAVHPFTRIKVSHRVSIWLIISVIMVCVVLHINATTEKVYVNTIDDHNRCPSKAHTLIFLPVWHKLPF